MSAEHNVSRSPLKSGDAMQSANVSCVNEDTLEDAAGSADNSIIGKVKSRVSSIIPTSLSKWFSPSARINNNDTSINGSLNAGTARRRRRIEIEDDDDEYGNDNCDVDGGTQGEYKENSGKHHSLASKDTDEEESDNNDDDVPVPVQRVHRNFKLSGFVQQPPIKRSRISLDVTNVQENSLMQHQPLVASTPAIGQNQRGGNSQLPMFIHSSNPKYREDQASPRAYHTFSTDEEHVGMAKCSTSLLKINENTLQNVDKSPGIRSRRTLHIPAVSQAASEEYTMAGCLNRKRQSCTPTAITGIHNEGSIVEEKSSMRAPISVSFMAEANLDDQNKMNGRGMPYAGNKRQKLINGTEEPVTTEEGNDIDSASESSEGCSGNGNINATNRELSNNTVTQKKTGLFNMSSMNSRNGSRTSSFGNAINFYSHLEGRKSLFSSAAQGGMSGSTFNALNNSTLSLTSLNRRQFNASIYGSTSALSDSRLLNTFSPFYKGKTTYGGAAAYKKYGVGTSGVDAGANKWTPRMTPTLIRPTSSLSTLSSSNNSLAATGALSMGPNTSGEASSAISSTAKRILDLINDFATPLSEAKKMANNLKSNQQQLLPQTKARLNDADLQASRSMRLSQVRTPYMRPAVTLHPSKGASLPPVRELQVPSMSQLLQMKKMQSTTERSRQITMQNSKNTCTNVSKDYTLPITVENSADGNELPSQQQKHTNKIKNKIRSSARITASKDVTDLVDDEPPPAVNLPDIAFPLMQSVPKFDIVLPVPLAATAMTTKTELKIGNATSFKSPTAAGTPISSSKCKTFSFSPNDASDGKSTQKAAEIIPPAITTANRINFKFSAPIEVKTANTPSNNIMPTKNYKFSPPAIVNTNTTVHRLSPSTTAKLQQSPDTVPKLKSGSVLDALNKPFIMPKTTVITNDKTNVSKSFTNENKSFGTEFKKSSDKWECNTCLVRNENTVTKCVACETPRSTAVTSTPTSIPTISTMSSFGNQFKKPAGEWECDTCMIRNKQQSNKCIACETPRRNMTVGSNHVATTHIISTVNSFGDAFKPKANTWECPTCLINNKSVCNECVACQTKKPGSNSSVDTIISPPTVASTFKFGFNQPITPAVNVEDAGFKSIAVAQKASKWECEACMTRNDAERSKCVCCEQAKPGSQTVNESTPKFSFGSTAASKYTFGFGNSANTSKKEPAQPDTIKDSTKLKTDTNAKVISFGSSSVAINASSSGFSFGMPLTASTTPSHSLSKDAADGGNNSKIPASKENTATIAFSVNSSTTNSAATATTSFSFGTSKSTVNTIPTATMITIPSAKVSLPTTTTTTVATGPPVKSELASGFTSGNTATAVTTSQASSQPLGGFSFGMPIKAVTEQNKQNEKTVSSGFTFKAPSTTANVTTMNSNNNTKSFPFSTDQVSVTPSTSSVSAATSLQVAGKPAFNFGNPSLSATPTAAVLGSVTSTSGAISTTSVPTANAGGFNFGTGSGATPSVAKAVFSASAAAPNVVAASTAAMTNTTFSTGTVATHIFGSFGSSAPTSATTTSTAFGANIVKTTVPTTQNTANVFGSLSQSSQIESKPTAPGTLIFGSSKSSLGSAIPATTAPFTFGSVNSTAATTNTAATGSVSSTTSTSWPKSNFVFGSSANNSAVSNANEAPKQPMFGSFGSLQSAATPSMATTAPVATIFGNSATIASSNATPTFGATTATANATNIFGSNVSATAPTANLFGNASSNAPTATFGTAPAFGSSNNASNSIPTFGSAANVNPGFGGFTAGANATIANDGASAAKKSEPAFNFGASTAQGATGGFNFGGNAGSAPKPAFNFAAANAPAFNFTGTNEAPAAKPFLFGATPSAPMFNFSGGAVEGTPNAPFQFSAGAAPASSNIFAPTPTPGAQTALQARRKIRQPTRRLTPR